MNAIELETDIEQLIPPPVLKVLRRESVRRGIPLAKLIAEVVCEKARQITAAAA